MALVLVLAISILAIGGVFWVLQVRAAHQVEDDQVAVDVQEGADEAQRSRTLVSPREQWDGKSDLFCREGQKLEFKNIKGPVGVNAMGDCQLTLIGCEVGSDITVSASDDAMVTIEKGTVSGRRKAFSIRERARVTVRGSKITAGQTAADVDDDAVLMLYGTTVERDDSVPADSLPFPPLAFRVWKNGQLAMDGGRIHWLSDGVHAAPNALVLLRNVEVKTDLWSSARSAGTALQVSGATTAILVGGSITSEEVAIDVNDLSHLTLYGTKVSGKNRKDPGATVEQLDQAGPSDIAQTMRKLEPVREQRRKELDAHETIQSHACDGVNVCVNEVELRGQVKGQVVTMVDATGTIGSVTATGSFQGRVVACVRKRNQGRKIAGFVGGPGKLVCSWDVTISQGGSQMGSWGSDFERTD